MVVDPCFRLVLAYDGTDFCGWERQAQGERTVQGTLEESLHRLTGLKVRVEGAGRTDSGVHALGQVASFELRKEGLETGTLFRGLNALLPKDIRVMQAVRVAQDFHARYSARFKTYFYQIMQAPFDDPFKSRFFHRMAKLPDLDRIRSAATTLVGRRDFSAMMASGSDARSTFRNVMSIKVMGGKNWIRLFMTADGFLYRMVRNMVSLIMARAEGRVPESGMEEILASGDRRKAPPTFPAKGLFMWKIWY